MEPEKIQKLKDYLSEKQIDFVIHQNSHNIHSAEQGVQNKIGDLSSMAPTLVLKTEKGFLSAIISGETRLEYKKIKKELGLKNVSLASADQVKEITGAEVGSICLFNPGLETIIDTRLLEIEKIFGGCGLPGYTLEINSQDLADISNAGIFNFAKLKNS